jgi:hypothetical protein
MGEFSSTMHTYPVMAIIGSRSQKSMVLNAPALPITYLEMVAPRTSPGNIRRKQSAKFGGFGNNDRHMNMSFASLELSGAVRRHPIVSESCTFAAHPAHTECLWDLNGSSLVRRSLPPHNMKPSASLNNSDDAGPLLIVTNNTTYTVSKIP